MSSVHFCVCLQTFCDEMLHGWTCVHNKSPSRLSCSCGAHVPSSATDLIINYKEQQLSRMQVMREAEMMIYAFVSSSGLPPPQTPIRLSKFLLFPPSFQLCSLAHLSREIPPFISLSVLSVCVCVCLSVCLSVSLSLLVLLLSI